MFMKPEIIEGDYYQVETDQGTWWVPDDCVGNIIQDLEEFASYVEGKAISYEKKHGFGARLNAPGYMDCTPWSVFDTEEEAVDFLCETENLVACPECGELVEYDQETKKCPECGASTENAA